MILGFLETGHLLVNLVFLDFQISRFSILEIFSLHHYLGNLVVRYRGKIVKVFWIDPGQNGGL